jgi:hypothetical protein
VTKALTVSAQRAVLREAGIPNDWYLAGRGGVYVHYLSTTWGSGWRVTAPGKNIVDRRDTTVGGHPNTRRFGRGAWHTTEAIERAVTQAREKLGLA